MSLSTFIRCLAFGAFLFAAWPTFAQHESAPYAEGFPVTIRQSTPAEEDEKWRSIYTLVYNADTQLVESKYEHDEVLLHVKHQYDKDGEEIIRRTKHFPEGDWEVLKAKLTYDEQGRLEKKVFQDRDKEPDLTIIYRYPENGNVIQELEYRSTRDERHTYNAEGQLIYLNIPSDGLTITYTYDQRGNVENRLLSSNGEPQTEMIYEYDYDEFDGLVLMYLQILGSDHPGLEGEVHQDDEGRLLKIDLFDAQTGELANRIEYDYQ